MKLGKYLILFLVLMALLIVFGNNGLIDNLVMKEKQNILKDANLQLVHENYRLKREIYLLKNDIRHIETVARNDLGMVMKGDIVYKHVDR
ncbi:MAG: septum formation initiator family protein [Syntrophales bacterium]|nr:septum formation initiator family protein [Syntrophales bacterium]MDD5231952.1 septum formation initiator family protein [Syntrophales bacterium]MDD5531465.1 septum formation initiator family protein [Syntrophales bacterium]HPL63635.1 septum formation initiator family protein [Syntrophales bacterium]